MWQTSRVRFRTHIYFGIGLLAFAVGGSAHAQEKTLQAHPRGQAKVVIDGVLDELVWQKAQEGTNFVERSPDPGKAARVSPKVRVLYDRDALYVGIEVPLVQGVDKPQALNLLRDSFRLFSDDSISLKIDVNGDKKTTLGFAINPNNAQLDYLATDNGRQFLIEFDTVWESETSVRPGVWFAELRIPAEALARKSAKGNVSMGINITHDENAGRRVTDWSPLKPELGPIFAADYGRLEGIEEFRDGTPVTLLPYALLEYPGETILGVDLPVKVRAGGEVRARLLNDTWAELSLLTDFSQVDLDDSILNLDRFPLFFPEKRAFFLTASDIFSFGFDRNATPFFTRRIGLDDDSEVDPLWGGVKFYGREGRFRFGIQDALAISEATNFAVARARVDFGDSYVGAYWGMRHKLNPNEVTEESENYALGIDTEVRAFDGHLRMRGALSSASDGGVVLKDSMSASASVLWAGRVFSPQAGLLWVQPDYLPRIGFVRRSDFSSTSLSLPLTFRSPSKAIRRFGIGLSGNLDFDARFREPLGKRGGVDASLDLHRIVIGASATAVDDRVVEDFELFENFQVVSGTYQGWQTSIRLSNPGVRNPNIQASYTLNTGFFGGVNHRLATTIAGSAGKHFRLSANAVASFARFDTAKINSLAVNISSIVAPSPKLSFELALRLNTQRETTAALFRMRFRYRPGSDLFIVYRHELGFDGSFDATLTAKLNFRADFLL